MLCLGYGINKVILAPYVLYLYNKPFLEVLVQAYNIDYKPLFLYGIKLYKIIVYIKGIRGNNKGY